MRSDEENACSLRRLEGNHDPERASQVLHAEPAQRNRAGQPVGERRAAIAQIFAVKQCLVLQAMPHVFEQVANVRWIPEPELPGYMMDRSMRTEHPS
jgi:hypothetical protein